jgi:hypothetical protein
VKGFPKESQLKSMSLILQQEASYHAQGKPSNDARNQPTMAKKDLEGIYKLSEVAGQEYK